MILNIFKKLTKSAKNVCFLHSGQVGNSILAWNPIAKFSGKNIESFKKFAKKYKKRKLIGYFSYDLAYQLYKIKKTAKNDLKLPEIYFLAFDKWLETHKKTKTTTTFDKFQKNRLECKKLHFLETKITQNNGAPQMSGWTHSFETKITPANYSKAFKKIKHYIKEGDVYQINLTHRLEAKTKMPPRELFLKIIETNPVDFLAYIEGDGFEILSASPERFIKIQNRKIETCPIKGTRPRGKNKKQDEKLKKELIENKKEAAELNMITDLLRNDMGKVCKINSVKVEGSRLIQKCPTVWHTYSKITGRINEKFTPLEALISMLPGGSITGCPKKRAIEIIDELEPTTRSVYTGVIGHIDPTQNLDFNIAIRTIIKKGPKLYLQVGGGIVIDSKEKAEFQETLDKAASFMNIIEI